MSDIQGTQHWDTLVEHMQSHRASVGNPSFGELAARITEARVSQGIDPFAARVARSTVYDAFRIGRPRVNLQFAREIGLAMGADAELVESWIRACDRVDDERTVGPPNRSTVLTIMAAALGLNLTGRWLVDTLNLPIYLDMVGTALAAIALGPWHGAAVGAATNGVGVLSGGWNSIPFGLVNIAGALVWGYGVRRFGWGQTLLRYFGLNLVVAVVCSLIAVPILVFMFGGSVGHGQDALTETFRQLGEGMLTAVGTSNLMTSTADKLISGFIALVIISALPWGVRRSIPLVLVDQRPTPRA